MSVGSISVDLSCQVYPSREEPSGWGVGGEGRSAGSFPEQRLVIEPKVSADDKIYEVCYD